MGPTWQTSRQMDAALSSTRVVIADDHPLMLYATIQTFEDASGFDVVGKATTGHQVEPLVSRTRPSVVLLDLQLPGLDGLSCLALLRERHPNVPVVVFSGRDDLRRSRRRCAEAPSRTSRSRSTRATCPPSFARRSRATSTTRRPGSAWKPWRGSRARTIRTRSGGSWV
jgi:CheY-like chemotaxis protein